MLFQPFNKATRRETPGFLDAEISQAKFEDSARQQRNALRSGNILGGATLYNEAMGESTPIADYLFGAEATPAATGVEAAMPSGTELFAPAAATGGTAGALEGAGALEAAGLTAPAGANLLSSAAAPLGATGVEAAMPASAELFGSAEAAAAGAEAMAGAEAAGAAGAAGESLLASMGPMGWVALAGLALANL